MFIVFKAKKEVKSEVFLEITAGPSRAYDLNVTQSLIKGNSGRGKSYPFKFNFHNFLRVLVFKVVAMSLEIQNEM